MLRYAGPLLVFGLLVVVLYAGLGLDPKLVPSPFVGKPAPQVDLPSLSEPAVRVRNSDLLGKPVLLNVWASWCVACRAEHPVLLQLAKTASLTIIGMDYKDRPEDGAAWLQQFGNPYKQVLVDRDGKTGIEWGVYGVPESFVLDAKGTVLYKHVGPLSWDDVQKKILPLVTQTTTAKLQ